MDIFKSFFAGRVEEIFIKFNDNVEEYIKIPGKILLWVFLSLLIFFLFYAIRFDGLTKIDAMDTAQIARNVATGEGFTTKLIRPYALTVSPDIVDHPELTAPPLYTMVLAGMFRVFGATDRVVALTSSLFYLLSIPLIFLMACKLFDSKTAFLTLALYITNSAMLDYSISGLPMSFLIFMFMLFLFVLYYLNEESVLITLLAGLLLGLCFLSQYAYGLLYFVVVFHIMSSFESKKIRHIVYFTLIFVLSISPWLYRNYVVTGNPFYTLEFYKSIMFSNIFPGNSFLRIVRDINIPNKALGLALVQKTYYGIQALYRQIIFLPNNYLMVLFLVSLFVLYENVRTFAFRRFYIFASFVFLIVMSLFYPGTNLLVPFIPFIIMAAAHYYYYAVDSSYFAISRKMKLLILTVFILINIFPLITKFIGGGKSARAQTEKQMKTIEQLVGPNEVVVTDIPWAIAWYCNRTAIWLPFSNLDYAKIEKIIGDIPNVYLSPTLFNYPAAENVKMWKSIFMTRKVPKEIYLEKGTYLRSGGMFMSQTAKWEQLKEEEESILPQME